MFLIGNDSVSLIDTPALAITIPTSAHQREMHFMGHSVCAIAYKHNIWLHEYYEATCHKFRNSLAHELTSMVDGGGAQFSQEQYRFHFRLRLRLF